jgi:hypothetical protein
MAPSALAARAASHVLVAALVTILLAGSFCVAMQSGDHNEHMYVTAAVLLLNGQRIYVDFTFFQMPYLPHIYRAAFAFTQTTRYLLTARVLNWLFWIAAALLVYGIGRALSGDRSLALGTAGLFATNLFSLRILQECSNYVLPLTLSLAALGCLLLARRPARHPAGALSLAFLAGLLVAGSVGTKLYYAAPALPLLVASWFVPPSAAAGLRGKLAAPVAMAIGFCLGVVPLAVAFARDPARFVFNNLGYHALVTSRVRLEGSGQPLTLKSKLGWFSNEILMSPSNLLLLVLCLSAAYFLWSRRRGRGGSEREPTSIARFASTTLIATLLAASAAALYMTPTWQQYGALPLPYVVLLFCCLWRLTSRREQGYLRLLVWLTVVVSLQGSGIVQAIRHLPPVGDWPPMRIHNESKRVSDLLNERGRRGRVATLRPLFAVEAGMDIYREFASGPFGYHIGHLLTAADRARFGVASPDTVEAVFASDPPAALLVGFYPERLEGPLIRYAESRCYERVELRGGARLYVRDAAPCPAPRGAISGGGTAEAASPRSSARARRDPRPADPPRAAAGWTR